MNIDTLELRELDPCGDEGRAEAEEGSTVGALWDSIETSLWMAEAYFGQGASGLAMECLRSAWMEYVRFRDVLNVYLGRDADALGERLVRTLARRAGDGCAASLGIDSAVEPDAVAA